MSFVLCTIEKIKFIDSNRAVFKEQLNKIKSHLFVREKFQMSKVDDSKNINLKLY